MAEDVTRKLIMQLYHKMEADAGNTCKTRNKDEIEYKICFLSDCQIKWSNGF